MMNRQQRRERERMTRQLRAHIARHGIEPVLDKMFGPGSWRYDPDEELWIVPDTQHVGPGRSYYCVRANGDAIAVILLDLGPAKACTRLVVAISDQCGLSAQEQRTRGIHIATSSGGIQAVEAV